MLIGFPLEQKVHFLRVCIPVSSVSYAYLMRIVCVSPAYRLCEHSYSSVLTLTHRHTLTTVIKCFTTSIMAVQKGFVVFTEVKINIGQLIKLGKTDDEIIEELEG